MVNNLKAKEYLREIENEDEKFSLVTGEKISSISMLLDMLPTMSNETFNYHVNDERNDFFNWIYEIIGDKVLAYEVDNDRDKQKFILILKKRVLELKRATGEYSTNIKSILKIVKKVSRIPPDERTETNITENEFLKKSKAYRINRSRPKRHEYSRCDHEHIHGMLWEFLYGFITGIVLAILVFKILGKI